MYFVVFIFHSSGISHLLQRYNFNPSWGVITLIIILVLILILMVLICSLLDVLVFFHLL